MLGITDLKTGVSFEHEGQPWLVISYQHSKLGRGGAVLKTKVRNLITGAVLDKTFKGSDKFEPVQLERKKAQYLYKDTSGYVFMDNKTFEQFNLSASQAGDASNYIKEGETVELAYYKDRPININISIKVKLKVTEAAEANKGNTATAATKSVKLETGHTVTVPLFIKKGDFLIIDTRTGDYVERAK